MEKISHRELQKMLWENAFQNAIPASNVFELTPLCNLDCRMCYVHLLDPEIKERMISGAEWISIMNEAVSLGMISAILTGGEAMTHPDFDAIYQNLLNQGISLTVKSNGILLNEKRLAYFREYTPSTIDVSLYGCDRESYLAVTGHDRFETVDQNLRAAVEAVLPMRLMITPSGYMKPWVNRIMDYARSFGAKTVVNTQLFSPHENTGRHKEDFDLSPEDIIEIKKRAYEIFPMNDLMFDEEEPADKKKERTIIGKPGELRCAAGRTSFTVCWDGVMTPCITFPREIISADARANGVKKAWNMIHAAVTDYRIPEQCTTCRYSGRCNYCPPSHGECALQHRCSPAACELSKRIIDEFRG